MKQLDPQRLLDETNSDQPAMQVRFYLRVIIKALILFLLVNLIFLVLEPSSAIGRFSLYNHLLPGRLRLPYGDIPEKAYNLSLYNINAMIASHEIAASNKPADEYRVVLIGDSSTWGYLLPPNQTLSACLNKFGVVLPDGRRLKAYNLGYPVMSLTKDLLILSSVIQYQPDLILWPVTLESFPADKQLFPPLLQNNPEIVRKLIDEYHLSLESNLPEFKRSSLWEDTIPGSRRHLADLVRLQIYGVMWAATGIDQYIPDDFVPRMENLPADENFHDLTPPTLQKADLAFDVIEAALSIAEKIPVLIINEPMFISDGINSDLRYNFFYPRWAYDEYRRLMFAESQKNGWDYIDLWNAVPPGEFTNSAIHMTPEGTCLFAGNIIEEIKKLASESGL